MLLCESWTVKKAECWRIDAFELWLEKTLESPLDCKEIQLVHSEGDRSWVFFGRTDSKAETPILCPPHVKSWLIGKDSDAWRDWGKEEKRMTEDEMVGWHHWLDGHELEWTPGVGDGQGGPACCDSWDRKESDTTGRLNWTELMYQIQTSKNEIKSLPLSGSVSTSNLYFSLGLIYNCMLHWCYFASPNFCMSYKLT